VRYFPDIYHHESLWLMWREAPGVAAGAESLSTCPASLGEGKLAHRRSRAACSRVIDRSAMNIVPIAWAGAGPECLLLINHGAWGRRAL
jgi:hypothetical protein